MKHVLHDGIPYKINMAAMRTVRIEEEVPSKSRSYWQCTRGHGISNRRVKTLEKGDTIGTAFCIKCGCHRAVTLTTIEGIKMEKPVVAPSEWSHS